MSTHAGSAPHRRDAILRIVREAPVRSQLELGGRLGALGFDVTQPTLSRDVRELGLVKGPEGYTAPAEAVPSGGGADAVDRALVDYALSVQRSGALVVVRTPPAEAQPLARALDSAGLPGVVGTLAGDDTIFVAAASVRAAGKLVDRLSAPIRPLRPRRKERRARA